MTTQSSGTQLYSVPDNPPSFEKDILERSQRLGFVPYGTPNRGVKGSDTETREVVESTCSSLREVSRAYQQGSISVKTLQGSISVIKKLSSIVNLP